MIKSCLAYIRLVKKHFLIMMHFQLIKTWPMARCDFVNHCIHDLYSHYIFFFNHALNRATEMYIQ
jgi:hypothetical protein